jgi:PAS domain S-box-containing protein
MSDASSDVDHRDPVDPAGEAPIHVLHVDDESGIRETTALWLERVNERFAVQTADGGEAALDRLASEPIDCVVSDYDMPGMNGLELLAAVREDHPDLPFILFTGKGSEEIASEAISAGVTDYLQKEVGNDQYTLLANRIERAVSERRTETALAESERMLSTLMSNLPGMVYRCRNERGWPMAFASDGAFDVIGYDADALVDGDVSYGTDVIHPDDREEVWTGVQAAIEEGVPYKLEYRVRTNHGATRWVRERGRAVETTDDGTELLEGVVTDITERTEQRRELATERDRLSALFENSGEPIAYCEFQDGDPVVRDVNSAFAEVFGYDREQAIDARLDELIVPDDHRDEGTAINQRARAGEQVVAETERETVDGRRQFRIRAIPIHPGEPSEEGWAVYTDVTAEREREATLRRTKRRYRRVVEQSLFGIYILRDGVLEYVNRRTAEIFGYEPAEMEGLRAADLVAEADHDTLRENVRAVRAGEIDEAHDEYAGVRKDGSTFDFEFHSAVIEYEGEPALLGALQDITDRKERERELERYERMLDTVGDGVYALDEDRRFIAVNETMTELTGYTREELIGASADLVIPERDAREAKQLRTELHRTDTDVVTMTLTIQRQDGGTVPCEVRFRQLIGPDGEYHGTAGVARDISDRRERESQLERQNERLEQFARLVSHDLRNPLNVAQTRLELLARTGEEEHYEKASEAHDRLDDIVEDVLELARRGRTVDEPEPVAVRQLAATAWDLTGGADATLTVTAPGTIRADRSRLQALFENLFRNAVAHAGPGVTVSVGVFGTDRPGGGGLFVADDGPGIPLTDREAVFEAGHSTDRSGTGFGLNIVETIAEAHGWAVFVVDADAVDIPAVPDASGAAFVFTGVDVQTIDED